MTVLEVTPLKWAQVRRGLLTAIAAVLFGVGWFFAQVVRVLRAILVGVGYSAGWCFAAVRVGWQAGRRGSA